MGRSHKAADSYRANQNKLGHKYYTPDSVRERLDTYGRFRLVAKFPGKCEQCGAPIAEGDTVAYRKGTGASCMSHWA